MFKILIMTNINKTCKDCSYWKEGQDDSTDDFDRGNDWICTKMNKIIAGFVEWHEVNKILIPHWCPLLLKNVRLAKLNKIFDGK